MDTHPSERTLAAAALRGAAPPHAASCRPCGDILAAYRSIAEALRTRLEAPGEAVEAAGRFYRRQRALESLIGALAEDPALRERARTDPVRVLRTAGLPGSEDLVALITPSRRIPRDDPEQRLAARRLWR